MADTNYQPTVIPEAPLPISMLPRAEQLTLQDLLLLTQPGNPQGQRTKALTLQLLAQFLGNMHFDSIVLQGSNGKSLTLNGDGTTLLVPHTTQSDQRDYSITENADGITLQVTGPNGTQKVVLGYTTSEISSTANGLTQKLTLGQNGITISNQTRVEGQVVTTEKQISRDHIDTQELEFFNTNFPKQGWKLGIANNPDANMKELVLQFAGTEAAQRFVVRADVLFTQHAQFEKDVTINADLFIGGTKTLNVGGNSNLHNTNVNGYLGIKQLLLSGAVGGGDGCWVCSTHPDNDFYNQTASTGHLWFVVNDTDTTQVVKYGTISGGGAISYETVSMPAHSITAFLRMGSLWYHWV